MIKRFGVSKYLIFSLLGISAITLFIFSFITVLTNSTISQLVSNTKSIDHNSYNLFSTIENVTKAHSSFTGLIATNDIDELEKNYNAGKTALEQVQTIYKGCTEKDCVEISTQTADYQKLYAHIVEDLVFAGKKGEAVDQYISKLGPIFDKILVLTKLYQNKQNAESQQTVIKAETDALYVKASIAGGLVFLSLLLFAFGWMLHKTLSSILNDVSQKLNSSAGNMDHQLTDMVSSSEYLSSSSSEQASVVHETISIVEQMNSAFAKSTENAHLSMSSSEEGKATALNGKEIMNDMLHAFEDISRSNGAVSEQLQKNATEIQRIVNVIQEISSKTKVINEIVFQTKLLSFNASVEAARAGEQGKGFSVVAEEVGNLATVSGQASKEISELLSNSLQLVNSISADMGKKAGDLVSLSDEKLKEGSAKAQKCEVMFDKIVELTQSFAENMGDVYRSNQEHTKAVSEIARAIREIDHTSQKSQSIAHQTSAVVQNLTDQATNLRSSIVELNELVDGKNKAA